MMRAYFTQKTTASARMMLPKEGPSTAAMASAKISSGMDRNTSTSRIRISSTRPPRKPARLPTMTPIIAAMLTTSERQVERRPGAPDHAVEHVAAIVGGAERVAGRAGRLARRAPVARHLVGVGRVRLGDDRRQEGHADHQDDDDEADHGRRVGQDACRPSSRPRSGGRARRIRGLAAACRAALGMSTTPSLPARRGGRDRRRSRRRRG